MAAGDKSPWSDDEQHYVEYLTAERHLFAWCLVTHGGVQWPQAKPEAEARYPYEPASDPYRGLIFHDQSWHWAMLAIFGERYWISHPEVAHPSDDYEREARKFFPKRDDGKKA